MAYKSSPRPVFTGPTAIPYRSVTRHVWGDAEAGFVDDWIYISTDKIHQLVFGLPPARTSAIPKASAPSLPPTRC